MKIAKILLALVLVVLAGLFLGSIQSILVAIFFVALEGVELLAKIHDKMKEG